MVTAAARTRTRPTDRAIAAGLFHALSDETRLAVLEMLRGGERCVCDLQDALGAAQSRLSFHLKVLKDAGLVTDRKEGRWSYYTLSIDGLDEVSAALGALTTPPPVAAAVPKLHAIQRVSSVDGRKGQRHTVPARSGGKGDGCC